MRNAPKARPMRYLRKRRAPPALPRAFAAWGLDRCAPPKRAVGSIGKAALSFDYIALPAELMRVSMGMDRAELRVCKGSTDPVLVCALCGRGGDDERMGASQTWHRMAPG